MGIAVFIYECNHVHVSPWVSESGPLKSMVSRSQGFVTLFMDMDTAWHKRIFLAYSRPINH